ncbi:hypothetical protein HMPREF9624_00268 [Oribacterium asaccharolyticum ACB7]|uniref:Addiction module toxin, RelE/StbE family n=1 Tax=Oribacterium asaccharolyticum ACB7 TaxID=796944 RepID=G9WUE3_9FIRM|nr:hypothetical protein HMPREF9624_00268 [Oribacterium asaccharolyticum ACB7]
MYRLVFSKKAFKDIKKLDKHTQQLIINWLEKNIDNTDNPRAKGKGLVGDKGGQWRYRIGDYRVICEILDKEVIVYALSVGHRSEIYN